MFDAIQKQLEAGTITQEVADSMDIEFSKALKKTNDENAGLRNKNKELTSSIDEVTSSKAELEKQVSELDGRIAKAKEEGKSELEGQLKTEREAKATLQKSLEGLEASTKALQKESLVNKALSGFDVKSSDREMVEFFLKSKVVDGENGFMFKDGDSNVSIEDGFTSYFETNGARLNPKGDGSGSGASGGSGGGQAVLSRETFDKMSPAQQAEAAKTKTIKD